MTWAYGALPWLAVLLCAALLLVALLYWPLRFDVSGRGRGEADGSWVVAGGASLSVLSLAFVWARGVPPQLTFLVWGHKLRMQPKWGERLARPVPERVKAASRRAWQRVAPLDLALKIIEERRHVRLRYLVVDVAYGFRDPILTGRLVGALAMLSGVLPRPVELRHAPRWDLEDSWDLSVDCRAFVRPWLALLDIAAYVVKRMLSRPVRAAQRLATAGPTEVR